MFFIPITFDNPTKACLFNKKYIVSIQTRITQFIQNLGLNRLQRLFLYQINFLQLVLVQLSKVGFLWNHVQLHFSLSLYDRYDRRQGCGHISPPPPYLLVFILFQFNFQSLNVIFWLKFEVTLLIIILMCIRNTYFIWLD